MTHSLLLFALFFPAILSIGLAETQVTQPATSSKGINTFGKFGFGWNVFTTSTGFATNIVGNGISLSESVGAADTSAQLANGDFIRILHSGAAANIHWFGAWDIIVGAGGTGFPFKRFQNFIFRGVPLTVGAAADLFMFGISLNMPAGASNTNPPNLTGAATVIPPTHYVAFLSAGTIAGGNWQCVTGTDAAHQTKVDSGISPDATATHEFRISYDGASTVSFFIDEALITSIQTNLPSQSDFMSAFYALSNSNTASDVQLGLCASSTFLS